MKKRCPRCEKEFNRLDGFHSGQGVCKKCNAQRVREWRARNPERAREQYRRSKANKRRKLKEKREREKFNCPVIVRD